MLPAVDIQPSHGLSWAIPYHQMVGVAGRKTVAGGAAATEIFFDPSPSPSSAVVLRFNQVHQAAKVEGKTLQGIIFHWPDTHIGGVEVLKGNQPTMFAK